MSNKKIVILLLSLFLFLLIIFLINVFLHKTISKGNTVPIIIGNKRFVVEVAKTNEQIKQGLSGRKEIGAVGMLFILPARNISTFWMKEMLFPLDFIWIDGDTVVDIMENVPIPIQGVKLMDLPLYSPKVPVTKVLEVPSGFIKSHNIKIGDNLK